MGRPTYNDGYLDGRKALRAEHDPMFAELRAEVARLRAVEAAAQAWVDHMAGSRDVCMGTAAALIAAVDGGGA